MTRKTTRCRCFNPTAHLPPEKDLWNAAMTVTFFSLTGSILYAACHTASWIKTSKSHKQWQTKLTLSLCLQAPSRIEIYRNDQDVLLKLPTKFYIVRPNLLGNINYLIPFWLYRFTFNLSKNLVYPFLVLYVET